MLEQVIQVYREYSGSGMLVLLFLASLLYLFYKSKGYRKWVVVYGSAVLFLLLLVPWMEEFYSSFLDDGTFRRTMWIVPMGVVIAYAGTELLHNSRKLMLPSLLLLVLCGGFMYQNTARLTIEKAENPYQIPQEVVAVCDYLLEEKEQYGWNVWAVFPQEFLIYVRQYTSDIVMLYGREMLDPAWNSGNALYDVMMKGTIDTAQMDELMDLQYTTSYMVVSAAQSFSEDPALYGYEKIAEIEGYAIFFNTAIGNR